MTNFAEEQHGSIMWAMVMIVPACGMLLFAGNVPLAAIRLTLIVSSIILFAAAAMAWSGFHYSFSPAGIEIRTLGFRVRSVSAADIRSYAVGRWNVIGGYGIRGLGNRRAYVWGTRGVRIKTTQGEVFLGHSEPEKIIRDLDIVTHNHEASEARVHF
ncbi:MAG TPA: hypothetical protein VL349_13220 [Terriglobales bacterium]|jgi:hypothetical protein|nr:hypothetical protein [Terriglobales bacterium]